MKKIIVPSTILLLLFGGLMFIFITISSLFVTEISANSCNNSSSLTIPSDPSGNAQKLFDFLTQKIGLSGAGASGALANAQRESNFDPQAQNEGGGVGGIFQWSGAMGNTINGSRLGTNSGYTGIDPNNSDTWTLDNEFKLIETELNSNYKSTRDAVGNATDPVQASDDWATGYEGLSLSDPQANVAVMNNNAVAYNTKYNSANIPSSIKDSVVGQAGSDNQASYYDSGCPVGGEADGTGEVPTDLSGSIWNGQDIPDSLKPFLMFDPSAQGLGWAVNTRWINSATGGQCAEFAQSILNLLYGETRKFPSGKDYAQGWADAEGGQVSKVPKAGAIGSVMPGDEGSDTINGHVYVVEHVFEDGTVLVVEENVKGFSGDDNGAPMTWDYRLIPQSVYSGDGTQFYTPQESATINN